MVDETIRKRNRNNKSRGRADENYVAKRLGGVRHLANTGGPEDVRHPDLVIQVKGGKSVITEILRQAMVTAVKGLAMYPGSSKIPAVVTADRKVPNKVTWMIHLSLEDYCAQQGYDIVSIKAALEEE